MPRRGRSMSSAPRRPFSRPPAPAAPAPVPMAAPPASMAAAPPQQPSLFKQMAATAAGVAVGSAVGHALTGSFSSGNNDSAATAAPVQEALAPVPIQQQSAGASQMHPCEFEIKQFMECAQNQSDITLCSGFNEAIKLCKQQSGISL